MLLKPVSQSPTDDATLAVTTMPPNGPRSPAPEGNGQQQDLLDDVWGSPSPSPPSSPSQHVRSTAMHHAHPSDLPRLQQAHVTAGYRDGITAAKAQSVQAGFDEGFGLGAALGQRAGWVLGVLEGITAALAGDGSVDAADAAERLTKAREELNVRVIFDGRYWDQDGTWTYPVHDQHGTEDEDGEIVFADVAAQHPLIDKWTALARAEAARWSLDLKILSKDDQDEDGAGAVEELISTRSEVRVADSSKKALEW